MIKLAAGDILYGKAGLTSAVSYTITGTENQGTTPIPRILSQGTMPSQPDDIYTVPVGRSATIDSIMLNNDTYEIISGVKFFINGTSLGHQLTVASIPANGSAIFNGVTWSIYDSNGLKLEISAISSNTYFP